MRRELIAISVLATSCWTSAPAPQPPTSTEEPAPLGSSRALASRLAEELRDPEDSMFVQRFVERQLLLVELDSGTIQVLCDAQTLTATVRFSELLNDPDRPPARCTIGATAASFICTQGSGAAYLRLDFARVDDDWRLLGGVLPRGPGAPPTDSALVREYRAKLGVAACPP